MHTTLFVSIAAALACGAAQLGSAAEPQPEPIDIGSRRELFVDDFVIDRLQDARQSLHHPTPREVAIVHDRPWEGNTCFYHTVFRDGDLYRMYSWKHGTDVVRLAGRPVRLRFELKDADLYSFQFTTGK